MWLLCRAPRENKVCLFFSSLDRFLLVWCFTIANGNTQVGTGGGGSGGLVRIFTTTSTSLGNIDVRGGGELWFIPLFGGSRPCGMLARDATHFRFPPFLAGTDQGLKQGWEATWNGDGQRGGESF